MDRDPDISVLQTWEEVGEAVRFLRRNSLPLHSTPEKNWDLALVERIARRVSRHGKVIDLGSAGVHALRLLSAMGFGDLVGVDLHVSAGDRTRQLKDTLRHGRLRIPYHIHRGDITEANRLPAGRYDLALCLSVIEHGVDPVRFFASARRILKPGGELLVTTDYWHSKLAAQSSGKPFGLDWKVFSKEEILDLIQAARRASLVIDAADVPACHDRVVAWNGREYTFLAMRFRRSAP